MNTIYALIIGYLADLCFGDPHWLPHPIRLIGTLIIKIETLLRKVFPKNDKGELAAGGVCVLIVTVLSTVVPYLILWLCGVIHPILKLIVQSVMCYQILAVKSLKDESMKVYHALQNGDTEAARYAVSMIVGRDTNSLDEAGIAKAAVETVAENTSDGILAPMLFMALGGAPAGFFYKAVNTMDSMIGYKNKKYLYFGRIAAKIDDLLNYLPARISAVLMIVSSFLLGYNSKNAYKIYKRDRLNHASPNSAHTEAVCAGALGIQLGGDAYYFGKLHKKQSIGDPRKKVEADDIKWANRLLYMTSLLGILLCSALWLAGTAFFAGL